MQVKKTEDFNQSQRDKILEQDGYKCIICGQGKREGLELHVDHIKPKSRGGKATINNGQTLCSRHNMLKRDYNQIEIGKKLFIQLGESAKKEGDGKIKKFCDDVLKLYKKHNIDMLDRIIREHL